MYVYIFKKTMFLTLVPDGCYEEKIAYLGNDAGGIFDQSILSPPSCQLACQKDDQCQFWTYNSSTKKCNFKHSNKSQGEKASDTSGPKYCNPAPTTTTTTITTTTTATTHFDVTIGPDSKCYYHDPRVYDWMYDSDNNTPQQCAQHCSDLGIGYSFYGVEYSSHCWCGNELPSEDLKEIDMSSCGMACSGDSLQICGGTHALLVGQVG